ncbi:MAG: hypothetical protein IJC68_00795 [Firmicutes bacterium]|nr:hypothetical protein [Bacillota bacterium]
MMQAEKWYEYQKSYQKYGLDMKPKAAPVAAQKPAKAAAATQNWREKAKVLVFTAFIGLLCICIIMITAYGAQAQYNLNKTLAKCDALESEIADLNAAIQKAGNIVLVEEKALEMGMVYPTHQEIISLTAGENGGEDLANALKSVAYNGQ